MLRYFIRRSVVAAALLTSTAAVANPSGWQFSEVSGEVEVTRDGRVLVARERATLHQGDVVRTSAGSRAVIVRGEEYVVVSPRSHIEIARPQEVGVVTQVIQYLGNALFKIEKKSTPHFGVDTPYMAAVVKGTTFNVSVSQAGTNVQVTEGAVEVATGDDLVAALLRPGMVGMVGADDVGSLVVVLDENRESDPSDIILRGAPLLVDQLQQAAPQRAQGVPLDQTDSESGSTQPATDGPDAPQAGAAGPAQGNAVAPNLVPANNTARADAATRPAPAAGSNRPSQIAASEVSSDVLETNIPFSGQGNASRPDVVAEVRSDAGAGSASASGDTPGSGSGFDDGEEIFVDAPVDEEEGERPDDLLNRDDDDDDDSSESSSGRGNSNSNAGGNGIGLGLGLTVGGGGEEVDDDDDVLDDLLGRDDDDDIRGNSGGNGNGGGRERALGILDLVRERIEDRAGSRGRNDD